jgi:dimethylargininase
MSILRHAIVRAPDATFANALSQQPEAEPIDLPLAQAQHRLVVRALQASGLQVTELPVAPGLPDACFVQDIVLLLPELAILGRPAEASRQGEVALMLPHLPPGLPVQAVEPPGTLEWGDVLRIDQTLFAGESGRTNVEGVNQVRQWLEPLGLTVELLPVPDGLHLLSGVNFLGTASSSPDAPGTLVAWEVYAGMPQFAGLDVIVVPPGEEPAANCLVLGSTVIMPAGYPSTAAAIWHRGFRVLSVPVSEFAKAAGGVTCLSVIY